THPGAAALRIHDVDGVSLWNVTVYGDLGTVLPGRGRAAAPAKGVVLLGDVRGFEARNNVFAALGDVAIEAEPPPGAAVSFDHDAFDLRSPLARWAGEAYATLDGPHGFRATGQERHGAAGSVGFRGVPGTLAKPPDVHLVHGVAVGLGAGLPARFRADVDGRTRPRWDAGAYVAGGTP